jgi:hypothetical protein
MTVPHKRALLIREINFLRCRKKNNSIVPSWSSQLGEEVIG